jgi:hypothetical protein
MANANVADFFGEGVNEGPLASNYVSPDDQPNPANPGGISNNELARRRAALKSSGVGGGFSTGGGSGRITPGGGGSRTMFSGVGDVFNVKNLKRGVAAVSTLGGSEIARATGSPALGMAYNPVGAIGNAKYAQPATDAALKLAGIDPNGGGGGGGAGGGVPGDPTQRVEDGSQAISDQLSPFIDESGQKGDEALAEFYGVEKPENTTVADTNAFVDEHAVDPSVARNAEVDRAFEMSSDLVDRILNAPSQARAIGDQSLSQQLALGRSSPGGIGNVQAGVKAAMGAAPRLQADAQLAAANEEQMRNQTAVSAAQIYAGVAQGTADREVRIAQGNQSSADTVLGVMTTQYGMDLNFTTEERGQIGQMARDFYANQAKFVGMDIESQSRAMDNIVKVYGIKSDFAAALKKIAADEGIGEMDALKLVLGGADAYMKYKTMGAL